MAAKRANGLVTRHQVAESLAKSIKTILAWEKDGLPVAVRGRSVPYPRPSLYDLAAVSAWANQRAMAPKELNIEGHRRAQQACQEAKRAKTMAIVCAECLKEFETTADRRAAKTCGGEECARKRRAARARRWKEKNREKWRATKRIDRLSDQAKVSKKLRGARQREKLKAERRAHPHRNAPLVCDQCWTLFTPHNNEKRCSKSCMSVARNIARLGGVLRHLARRRAAYRDDPLFRAKEVEKYRRYAKDHKDKVVAKAARNKAKHKQRDPEGYKAMCNAHTRAVRIRQRKALGDEEFAYRNWLRRIRKKYPNASDQLMALLEARREMIMDLIENATGVSPASPEWSVQTNKGAGVDPD